MFEFECVTHGEMVFILDRHTVVDWELFPTLEEANEAADDINNGRFFKLMKRKQ